MLPTGVLHNIFVETVTFPIKIFFLHLFVLIKDTLNWSKVTVNTYTVLYVLFIRESRKIKCITVSTKIVFNIDNNQKKEIITVSTVSLIK